MNSTTPHVVIIGGSFAGLTAAYELKRKLTNQVRVTVIDRNDQFVFIPSLIWVPFGWRTAKQITFPLRRSLERKSAEFLQATARRIDPERQVIEISQIDSPDRIEEIGYDYLLIATGPHVQFDVVPGLGPHGGFTQSICTIEHAERAGLAWTAFLNDPGPVIVGATQGSACYGAAYEFVFNLEYALRKAGIRDKASVTYVTSEPFAGHFGIGGMKHAPGMTEWFFRHTGINWAVNSVLDRVTPGEVHLKAGQLTSAKGTGPAVDLAGKLLPFKYAMIIPPFLGVEVVRASGLGNERGFIVTDDYFRHLRHPRSTQPAWPLQLLHRLRARPVVPYPKPGTSARSWRIRGVAAGRSAIGLRICTASAACPLRAMDKAMLTSAARMLGSSPRARR